MLEVQAASEALPGSVILLWLGLWSVGLPETIWKPPSMLLLAVKSTDAPLTVISMTVDAVEEGGHGGLL